MRMYNLIEYLFTELPGVTIVLSILIPNAKPDADDRIRTIFNPQYVNVVNTLQARQQRIVLADLYPVLTVADLVDGTHPKDEGYEKMAEAWATAIAEGGRKAFLVRPQNLGSPGSTVPITSA